MLFTLSNGLKVVVITHRETSCKGERTILLIDHIFSVGTLPPSNREDLSWQRKH